MIQVSLPFHLKTLAGVAGPVPLDLKGPATTRAVLDALETAYPVLLGTLRDQATKKRRAFVRFFACGQDVSLDPDDRPLPEPVASGREPFLVVGAIAGG